MFKTNFFLKIFDLKEIKSKKFFLAPLGILRGGQKFAYFCPPLLTFLRTPMLGTYDRVKRTAEDKSEWRAMVVNHLREVDTLLLILIM